MCLRIDAFCPAENNNLRVSLSIDADDLAVGWAGPGAGRGQRVMGYHTYGSHRLMYVSIILRRHQIAKSIGFSQEAAQMILAKT